LTNVRQITNEAPEEDPADANGWWPTILWVSGAVQGWLRKQPYLSPTIGIESQVGIFVSSHSQHSLLTRDLQRVFFILLLFDILFVYR